MVLVLPRRAAAATLAALSVAVPRPGRAEGEAPDPSRVRALLIRHARAPGTGDPPGFRLGDCATQRNLNPQGRAQAARLGEALRARGLAPDEVRAGRWCRAWDTARLMGFGEPVPLDALDSIFAGRGEPGPTGAALRAFVGAIPPGRRVAMVTHAVNAIALTGSSLREAEAMLLDERARVLGRLYAPHDPD